MYENNNPD